MKAWQLIVALAIFGGGYLFGVRSVEVYAPEPTQGVVDSATVAHGMTEHHPDTVWVPTPYTVTEWRDRPSDPQSTPVERVPLHDLTDSARVEGLTLAAIDWSTVRRYNGVLFDSEQSGRATYSFEVQYNKAGAIAYHYTPPKPRVAAKQWRKVAALECYSGGLVSVGGGVRWGRVDLTARILYDAQGVARPGVGVAVAF